MWNRVEVSIFQHTLNSCCDSSVVCLCVVGLKENSIYSARDFVCLICNHNAIVRCENI